YLQNIRGYTPMQAGMLMLPAAIVTGIMMPISGRLFDKFGAKWLTIIGLSILTISSYFLSRLTLETSYNTVMMIMMVRGIGMGLAIMPTQTAGMNAIPRELTGRGTALNSTVKQVSGSFGIAILTTILGHREAFHAVRDSGIKQVAVAAINDTLLVATLVCFVGIVVAFFIKNKTVGVLEQKKSKIERYEQALVEEILSEI
ncbi:MAG TPA: MFS transporter, partial [Clostridium sp.]|uniref:MFS transporter n=1 Tax=Clostridium sp. TaxID=1506 RepID=UPI002F941F88